MRNGCSGCDRRRFIASGLGGLAWAALPGLLPFRVTGAGEAAADGDVRALVRPATLFAGIRGPIAGRDELAPRLEILDRACAGKVAGPLTHIFRFDTQVEGFDSELGYPVAAEVAGDGVATHTLREMHFYARRHDGPVETLRDTARSLYATMDRTGLSPELELVEVYPEHVPGRALAAPVEVMASFLAWPEVYRAQLERVLGAERVAAVWQGGETMTPFTPVDPRCTWVTASIARLKACTDQDQQFDILSRVALVRPREEVAKYKAVYDDTGDITAVFRAQDAHLRTTRTGGFVDPPRLEDGVLHISKVPRDGAAWAAAATPTEKRKAFCFCNLVREAADPRIDPIFCYRAAGWARQFWEPVLGVTFTRCTITHSVLKGDAFCAWDYAMPGKVPPSRA